VLTRVERLGILVRYRIEARSFSATRKRFVHAMANKAGMEFQSAGSGKFQSEIPAKTKSA
jgi:hypothetical protein